LSTTFCYCEITSPPYNTSVKKGTTITITVCVYCRQPDGSYSGEPDYDITLTLVDVETGSQVESIGTCKTGSNGCCSVTYTLPALENKDYYIKATGTKINYPTVEDKVKILYYWDTIIDIFAPAVAEVGETVTVTARLQAQDPRDNNWYPAPNEWLYYEVRREDGSLLTSGTVETDSNGEAQFSFTPDTRGVYTIDVTHYKTPSPSHSDQTFKDWENHSDIAHEDWEDHDDIVHSDWENHDDVAHEDWGDHTDIEHQDWGDYNDQPAEQWFDHSNVEHSDWYNHGNVPHTDWDNHNNVAHINWGDHGDSAHLDWGDYDDRAHTDWDNHDDVAHSDWGDHVDVSHLNWDDHGDSAHDDWGNHTNNPHNDTILHRDWTNWL